IRCSVPIVRSGGAMKNEAYAAAPISDTTIAAKMARFHITLHSSRRYSPKSHNAVKNTMSNATRNPTPFHNTYGDRSSSAAVTSVLAINIGVSIGNNNSGKSSPPILPCAEIEDSAVPAIETPRLPRKNTSTSHGNTLVTVTLYITANTGSSNSSVTIRNNVFAASSARKIANESDTDRRSALSVSFVCSRKKHGCNINDAANKNASHNNPEPNPRASSESGSNVKLNNTSTMMTNTIVVVSSSRDRNSVFSSLPSSTVVLAIKLNPPSFQPTATVGAQHCCAPARQDAHFKHDRLRSHSPPPAKTEFISAPFFVSAITVPLSSRIPRVANPEISDSPCKLINNVHPASRIPRSVSANHAIPCESSPVAGSSSNITDGSVSNARAIATRCRIPRENARTNDARRSVSETSSSSAATRSFGCPIPCNRANKTKFSSAVSSS